MQQSFTPFTKEALPREKEAMFLLLMLEGVDPFNPIDESLDSYNNSLALVEAMLDEVGSIEECFTLVLEGDRVKIECSDALLTAGEDIPAEEVRT